MSNQIKINRMVVEEKGPIFILQRNGNESAGYSGNHPIKIVKQLLNRGLFEDTIHAIVGNEFDGWTPNGIASEKAIKRLRNIIKDTPYKTIIEQDKQNFIIKKD